MSLRKSTQELQESNQAIYPKMHPKANKQYLVQTRFLFHSNIKVKIPIESGNALLNKCFDIFEHIDRTYNSYSKGSYFDRINSNAGKWIEVDDQVVFLINQLNKIAHLTEGAYNISIMPLLKLWGFYTNSEVDIPSEVELHKVTELIRNTGVQLNGQMAKIDVGQELITGSFIKSYATDQVINFLKSEGVTDAIINAGGSTICALTNNEHPEWKINLPHPVNNVMWNEISLQNAFSISGRREHFRLINGKAFGHIINASTGWPSDNLQAGVIADTAFLSDVLSTALFATEAHKVAKVAEQLKKEYPARFSYYHIDNEWNGEDIVFK